eukprot:CAMPEP_0202686260 /NCGR_PEP_ID=MMETSP1385-20130828/2070_1 /ASSEMBLY_ACC=CAM_ASM_000861 /TAXON_ID=933848 /ORGANISM="Elphidium margaritaceum" /LENGTH=199 /DNA_ID=CAMNT_0049340797 /DNA_START=101 /DNA_END=700 /DNA_ORIENTATION=+
MVKYMRNEPKCQDWAKAAKAKCEGLRVSYKNTHETASCLKGMSTARAKRFLKNVIRCREIVPFRRHTGGIGRHSQCKGTGCAQGRWPKKSCYFLLDMVRNVEQNARAKGLKKQQLYLSHIAVQRARQGKRRTYRAHGRINPFNSHPCHVEMFVEERGEKVPKSQSKTSFKKNPTINSDLDKKTRRDDRHAKRVMRIFDY